jgi:hypothetical protein
MGMNKTPETVVTITFLRRWVRFTTGGHVTSSLDINLDNRFK